MKLKELLESREITKEELAKLIRKARERSGKIKKPSGAMNWYHSVTFQDGKPILWYNDEEGNTKVVSL